MSRVIDTHLHFWNLDLFRYEWLDGLDPINRTIEPPELLPQLASSPVTSAVLVQCLDLSAETDYLLDLADSHDFVAGVVGWLPLRDASALPGAIAHRLDSPWFCGVRHLMHLESDPDWLIRPDVVAGLRVLAEHDLPFDVVAVTDRHLEVTSQLADMVPELRIVVDHLGKPPIAEREFEPWRTLLSRAASHPNVYAKVSGLNTAAAPAWTPADLQPYVDHALEVFGAERLMFGSDWAVAMLADTYERVWDATLTTLERLPESQRSMVLGGTAAEVYSLADK